jgi:hypothetical protein
MYILSFATLFFPPIQETQNGNSFHQTGSGIAEKPAPRFQSPVNSNMMFWGHEEVARFGGVMRSLFGNIIASRMIRIVPIASERLPQYGIQGFFNPTITCQSRLAQAKWASYGGLMCHPLR